jgi:hypothetical protein
MNVVDCLFLESMQLGTKENMYVDNQDVHERRASRPSTISRDIKRVFTGSSQSMATVGSISASGTAAQGARKSGLDLTISSSI